jgi:ribosomal protein S18 acetylase RimI-like enzyme
MKIIKEIKKDEIDLFVKLFQGVFKQGFRNYPLNAKKYILDLWNKSFIEGKLSSKDYLLLMATKNGDPVGLLIAKYYDKRSISYILWLGVLEKYQGYGIGSKLVDSWEKWAVKKGAHGLRASTSNFSNENFYKILGYNKYSKRVKNDWGMDKLVFLKKFN